MVNTDPPQWTGTYLHTGTPEWETKGGINYMRWAPCSWGGYLPCVAGSFKEATIHDMCMTRLHSLVFMPRHK